jgi:hypothetical protein
MYVQNQSYFFHWNQPKKKTEEMYYQNYVTLGMFRVTK